MTIEERINLLEEARDFFADLGEAGSLNERLGERKAAALATVADGLEKFKTTFLMDKEWDEENLREAMNLVIDEEKINAMIEKFGMDNLEAEFYEGGFGLAIGILQEDEESINGFRELQEEYENIRGKQKKTIADLIK